MLTICREDDGTDVTVYCSRDVLKEVAKHRPAVGDKIGIRYFGKPEGKRYEKYRVLAEKPVQLDYSKMEAEAEAELADEPGYRDDAEGFDDEFPERAREDLTPSSRCLRRLRPSCPTKRRSCACSITSPRRWVKEWPTNPATDPTDDDRTGGPRENALDAKGCNPRRNGEGYSALCPAHDDRNPSLSLRDGDKGGTVVTGHAGCNLAGILAAVDLPMDAVRPRRDNDSGQTWSPHSHLSPVVDVYPYVDVGGQLLFEVLRHADKHFMQRRPDPCTKSGWKWKSSETRPLYRLPWCSQSGRRWGHHLRRRG